MKNDKTEFRVLHGLQVEQRAEGEPKQITGYAAVYDKDSENLGYFTEVIRQGAFTKSLKQLPDVRALLGHNPEAIVGRTKAGNLTLTEDDKGVRMSLTPISTTDGEKALEWVKSGVVDGMSIGFRVVTDRWSMKGGKNYREILEAELFEVSLVAWPAYKDTSASVRGLEDAAKDGEERLALHLATESAKRMLRVNKN